MNKPLKTIFSLLVFSAFALMALGSKDSDKNTEAQIQESLKTTAPIDISAPQLYAEYEENGVAADQNYKGKVLRVTGIVNSIDKDIMDNIYVALQGNDIIGDVQCFFSDDNANKAAQLKKGQKITVIGKCDGKMMNIMMKGCIME